MWISYRIRNWSRIRKWIRIRIVLQCRIRVRIDLMRICGSSTLSLGIRQFSYPYTALGALHTVRYRLWELRNFLYLARISPAVHCGPGVGRGAAGGRDERLPGSVADPNPDPPDPHVFGPPGSGSISQRYGSGSFYHHAKIVRQTLIPTIFWLFLTFEKWCKCSFKK